MITNPLHHFHYCPQCGAEGFRDHAERAKHCASCGLTYFHNTASAVAILLRDRTGQYLFVRRAHAPAEGTLDLPGGFVDPMETVEAAVARELLEETGLRVERMRYLTSRPNRYPFSGVLVYTSDLFFLAEVDSFDGAVAHDDAAALVMRRLSDCRAEDFGLESIRGFMTELLEGERGALHSLLHSEPADASALT